MVESSEIFENHYLDYCAQLAAVDFGSVADTLGITDSNGGVSIPFFNLHYRISSKGIEDPSGNRPVYAICVILAKYVLLCPDRPIADPAWISFKDFKQTSHFNNVNYFASDVERVIVKHFGGRLIQLQKACSALAVRTSKRFLIFLKPLLFK